MDIEYEPLSLPSRRITISNNHMERNSYYPKFLILIGLFYILPSLQFVFFQSRDKSIYCYYNYECKNDLHFIPSFNSIISNILYIIYGIIFIIVVKQTDKKIDRSYIDLDLRRPPFLYYSLAISLIFEGICSATYHICPTKLNFQFDTTFMFIGGILMYITIYSKRHEEPDPMKIYSFLCFLIFVNILPLSGLTSDFERYFWGSVFIIIAYILINISLHIYFGENFEIDVYNFKKMSKNLKKLNRKEMPKVVLLVIINLFTLGMYIWAVITQPTFTDWVLGIIIINMLIYFCYYLIQKIVHKENISLHFWIWLVVDFVIIALSLVFFLKTSTNIFLSPAESNKLNKECILFNYFDYHDIWHILSSTGLFIFMNIVFFLDRELDTIPTTETIIF